MIKSVGGFLMVLTATCLLAGCITQRLVQVGARTPSSFGDIKVYGTANVPFEYEELAVLAQGTDMSVYSEDESLKMFAEKALAVKADAILNFKIEVMPGVGGFFAVFSAIGPGTSYMTLSGTAVKIKRP